MVQNKRAGQIEDENKTESNRATVNPRIEDGRILVSKSGKEYCLRLFKTVEAPEGIYTVTKRGFLIEALPEKQTIGSVTNHMSDARLFSLLERRENPRAMEPVEFLGKISGTKSGFVYIPVINACEWANMRVDDCFTVTITRKNGDVLTDPLHHLSLMKSTPIINLSRLRRFSRRVDEEGEHYVHTIPDYLRGSPEVMKDLFLQPGEVVKVSLTPDPNSQEFYFADNL